MAISFTHLTTDIDDSNLTVYTTASFTTTSGRWIFVGISIADTNPAGTPILAKTGCTFNLEKSVEYDSSGTRYSAFLFSAVVSSTSTGTMTITATEPVAGCGWHVSETTGYDSADLVQGSAVTNTGTSTTPSADLPGFVSISNAAFAFIAVNADGALTAGTNFTILGQDQSSASAPTHRVGGEWAINDNTVTATSPSGDWAVIAVEVKASGAVGAGFPVVNYYLALGNNPLDAAPTWTHVPSDLVQKFQITSSGRSLDIEDFEGGSGSITFYNDDGRFTPGNTASPYYPNIRFRVPIRVEASRGSLMLTVRGYIDATPVSFPNPPSEALCEWPIVDAFVLLNEQEAEYPWKMAIRHTGPKLWLNYGELSGTTVVDDSGNGYYGTYVGSPTLQVAFGTGIGATFDGITQEAQIPSGASITGTGDFAVEFYGDFSVTGTDQYVYSQFDFTLNQGMRCGCLSTGQAFMQTTDGSGTTSVTSTATDVASGAEKHIIWQRQGTTHEVLINGVSDGTTVGTARNIPAAGIGAPGVTAAVTIDALITYQTTVTQAEALAHYAAFLAWHALPAGLQIDDALDAFGWPDADRNLDTNAAQVLGQFVPQGSVLDMLRLIANSDFGAIYVTLGGVIRFRRRQSIMAAPYTTSQGVFGNDTAGGANPVIIQSLVLNYDASRIKNDITLKVNWQTGPIDTSPYEVMVRLIDQTSARLYSTRTFSRDVYTMVPGGTGQTAILLNSLARYVLTRYKDPLREVRELVLRPIGTSTDELWEHVLTRTQEDRITHTHTLPGGEIVSGDYHIQRIKHEIGPTKIWQTTWTISPADTVDWWVLGTSKLGQTTRIAV